MNTPSIMALGQSAFRDREREMKTEIMYNLVFAIKTLSVGADSFRARIPGLSPTDLV